MAERSLKEKFRDLREKIILEEYEVCPYKNICPYKRISDLDCLGCDENRPWKFICDIKRLKEY